MKLSIGSSRGQVKAANGIRWSGQIQVESHLLLGHLDWSDWP
jgi:hypothetical protein